MQSEDLLLGLACLKLLEVSLFKILNISSCLAALLFPDTKSVSMRLSLESIGSAYFLEPLSSISTSRPALPPFFFLELSQYVPLL